MGSHTSENCAVQPSSDGLAQAFIIGREFIGDSACCLVLGDNIFYGHDLSRDMQNAAWKNDGAIVFAYPVLDPPRYGVVEFDSNGRAISLWERFKQPKSHFATTGLEFDDDDVLDIAGLSKSSDRGEREITDVNKHYLSAGKLDVVVMSRGYAWLNTGTRESMLDSSQFIEMIARCWVCTKCRKWR